MDNNLEANKLIIIKIQERFIKCHDKPSSSNDRCSICMNHVAFTVTQNIGRESKDDCE